MIKRYFVAVIFSCIIIILQSQNQLINCNSQFKQANDRYKKNNSLASILEMGEKLSSGMYILVVYTLNDSCKIKISKY